MARARRGSKRRQSTATDDPATGAGTDDFLGQVGGIRFLEPSPREPIDQGRIELHELEPGVAILRIPDAEQ